jgi:transaldolase
MKIFLDTADVESIASRYATGLVDGVTTNPTLIRKSGKDPLDVYRELVDLGLTDISMEVVGNVEEMYHDAMQLHAEFKEVATIKLPCTPDGLQVCKSLSELGIRTNVTLIFSAAQAILAAKAGATYVSPFIGRYDDNSISGLELVRSITSIYQVQGVETQVLAASLRDVSKVSRAFYNGAHIVTMPTGVFDKMYNHVLTEKGLDLFQKDYDETMASLEQPKTDAWSYE